VRHTLSVAAPRVFTTNARFDDHVRADPNLFLKVKKQVHLHHRPSPKKYCGPCPIRLIEAPVVGRVPSAQSHGGIMTTEVALNALRYLSLHFGKVFRNTQAE